MRRCGKYLGDNDGTCPQLTCVREEGHPGLCDNVSDRPDMPRAIERYRLIGDRLREQRRLSHWKAEDDRSLLDEMEDLYMLFSSSEIDEVEAEGWRNWPDLYDAEMKRRGSDSET